MRNGRDQHGESHVAGVAALWWEAARHEGIPVTAEYVEHRMVGAARRDVFAIGVQNADRGYGLISSP